jgi:hypothetical protein
MAAHSILSVRSMTVARLPERDSLERRPGEDEMRCRRQDSFGRARVRALPSLELRRGNAKAAALARLVLEDNVQSVDDTGDVLNIVVSVNWDGERV